MILDIFFNYIYFFAFGIKNYFSIFMH